MISLEDENTIEVNPTIFPDGCSQVWKLPDFVFYDQYQVYTIIWDFEHEAELFHVLQLSDLIGKTRYKNCNLFMPYLPYGRQDKKAGNDRTFALNTLLDILNKHSTLGVISTLDAHNSLVLGNVIKSIQPTAQIKYAIDAVKPDLIVFPDAGAAKRGYNIQGLESIVLDKKRNQLTGEIEGLEYTGNVRVGDKSLLIVDDITDGGKTFIEAAKLLKDLDATGISLYTSHMLATKGTKVLKDAGISRLFDKNGERE